MMGATVLILGVGRFGAHYVRIFSGLNADRPPRIPAIDRLVLTRTRIDTAAKLAAQVRRDPNCTVTEVVGLAVANARDLAGALHRFRPDLTCLTGTDRTIGDALHAVYAETVFEESQSRVLSEKPLCPAAGDGNSLSAVRRLRHAGGEGRFGLELPMAVVRQKMETNPALARSLVRARRLDFFWSTRSPLRESLVDTLAIHPWSLIPGNLCAERLESAAGTDRVDIRGQLVNRVDGTAVELTITLRAEQNLRWMAVDGRRWTVESDGPQVSILIEPKGADALPGAVPRPRRLSPSVVVDNPLRENILASLCGAPVTGLADTEAAQRFLEMAKGWSGN